MFKNLKYKNKSLSISNGIYFKSKKTTMYDTSRTVGFKRKKFIILLNKKRRDFNRFY